MTTCQKNLLYGFDANSEPDKLFSSGGAIGQDSQATAHNNRASSRSDSANLGFSSRDLKLALLQVFSLYIQKVFKQFIQIYIDIVQNLVKP